ncbi:MAG: SPASM domain-containing protein [Candidatus Aureabacteria bacterium]|nr:SPASM domain-containing protein [Candidatus Auribacterota bacterium]
MKIINKIVSSYLEKRRQAKPPVLRIETTNACNASCITCPRPKMTRKIGTMDMSLFGSLIEQAGLLGIKKVHLHNYGEPLLDKELKEKIACAKSKGMHVKIFTNASLLSDEKAKEVVSAGIDEIKISMDGVTKETFERIRKNLKFDDVTQGIENIIKARKRAKKPGLHLVLVAFDENREEISLLKKRWKGRVDSVIVTRYHNWAEENEDKLTLLQKLQRKIPCARLWKTVTVLWDGRVALCCLDFDGHMILGDLSRHSLKEIWEGEGYQRVRSLHIRGEQDNIPLCRSCTIGRL